MKFEGKRKGSRGSDPQRDKCLLEEFFTREREREARLRKEIKGHRSSQLPAIR